MKSAQQIKQDGTGVYCLTKKDAGEACKEARRYKITGDVNHWTRRRGKASK